MKIKIWFEEFYYPKNVVENRTEELSQYENVFWHVFTKTTPQDSILNEIRNGQLFWNPHSITYKSYEHFFSHLRSFTKWKIVIFEEDSRWSEILHTWHKLDFDAYHYFNSFVNLFDIIQDIPIQHHTHNQASYNNFPRRKKGVLPS